MTLKRPGKGYAKTDPRTVSLTLVEAREIDPQVNEMPLLWRLLTTLEVGVAGCVTGTHPPKLSVGGDRAIDPADDVSDAFRSNLGAVLAIPRNFAMVAGPERC